MEFKLFLSKVFYIEGFATTISESHEVKKKSEPIYNIKKNILFLKISPSTTQNPLGVSPLEKK